MSAWGGANSKSCQALLDRVEQNDPNLTELFILPTKTFGGVELNRLASLLGINTHLQKLSASGHPVPNESLQKLGNALATRNRNHKDALRSLAIGDHSMGDSGVEAFTKGLQEGSNNNAVCIPLEEIDFSWKGIGYSGFELLLKCLDSTKCPRLRILNLSRNESIGEAPTIHCSFASISQLESLDLSQCGLTGDFLVQFLASLPGVPTASETDERIQSNLRNLQIQQNPIGTEGFKALLPLIANSNLQQLNVSKCQIDDGAVKCFRITNPAYSNNLQQLDLSYNALTSVGAQVLSLALESPNSVLCNLKELNLAGNTEIGEFGVQMLSDALEKRRAEPPQQQTLETLDLTNTNCGIKGALEIITRGNLKTLHLFNNALGSDGFLALSQVLTGGHATLETLDLGGNQADQASVVVLLSALIEKTAEAEEHGNQLKLLVVGGNEGGVAVEQMVSRIHEIYPSLDVARDKMEQQQQQ